MATIEGELLKDGGWRRGWRKRYFKLSKIYFQYFENHHSTGPKGALVRGTINNVELIDINTYQFKVTFKNEVWDLKATSKPELIKWMEALKPNSTNIIKQSTITPARPVTAPTGNVSATTFQPEPTENQYQTLPSTNTQHMISRHSGGSDGRTSPSTSLASNRMSTPADISNTPLSNNTSSSVRSLNPTINNSVASSKPADYEDPLDKFHTSEPGSEPSLAQTTVQLAPVVVKEGIEEGIEFEDDDDEFLDFSEGEKGQVTYELKETERSDSPSTIPSLPVSDGKTLNIKTLSSNVFTTMKINEWIKSVKPVEKAFVDPMEQDLGTLDTYLVNNAPCLPGDGIVLLNKIGNGAFGEVWKARCTPPIGGDAEAAIKILKEGSTDKHRHDFYGEAVLLGQFKHPNVIALHGVVLRAEAPWIVIEYAENGALKSFLKKHASNRHSNQLLSYCRDIVRGMKYLSERGYIHRDLAARNVLLTKFEVAKIADFGLSRKLGDDDDIYVSRGGMVAIKWTAPEGIISASYSSASDVWSCGVTMWEIFSEGCNPWSGFSNEEAFRRIRKGHALNQPEKCPLDVYKAMVTCWTLNPLDRPTFADLERSLFDPDTDNVEQPLYESSDGFVQYVNMQYENMPDVEQA